jgi:hypothetical protein
MGLKTALVIDCPSVDAAPGRLLSDFEWNSLQELMAASGFRPDKILVASRAYFNKWDSLFTAKVGSQLTTTAEADRQILLSQLEGFDMALTLGSHAMYCLTGETKIDTFRGTHIDSPYAPGLQVVPTYAPSIFIYRNWAERPVVASAMGKALTRYQDRPRTIFLPDSPADLYWFATKYIKSEIVFDVETNVKARITEFSLATSSAECLYVYLEDAYHKSIWSEQDELDIWLWLSLLARRKDLAWGFQNATYDLTYLDKYGVRPAGPIFDTMLRHHAWQPELEKSLGFLASLHVPTRAWKHLRKESKKNINKAGAI